MSTAVEDEIWSKLCQESAAGNTLTSQILSYRLPRGGFGGTGGKLLRNVWLFYYFNVTMRARDISFQR
jgi:hypothetical protein